MIACRDERTCDDKFLNLHIDCPWACKLDRENNTECRNSTTDEKYGDCCCFWPKINARHINRFIYLIIIRKTKNVYKIQLGKSLGCKYRLIL